MPLKGAICRSTYSCTSSTAFLSQFCTPRLPFRREAVEAEVARAQRLQAVADGGRTFEIEIGGGRLHFPVETRNLGVQFRLGVEHLARVTRCRRRAVVAFVDAGQHVVDLAHLSLIHISEPTRLLSISYA